MLSLISWFSFRPCYKFAKRFRQIVSESKTKIRSVITSRTTGSSGSYSGIIGSSRDNSRNGERYQW